MINMNIKIVINSIFFWIFLTNLSNMLPMTIARAEMAKEVKYDAKGKRDPFVPLVYKLTEVSGLIGVTSVDDIRLEGVVVDVKNGSIAVANGVVLKEGETRDGVKVLQIKEDGVSFDIKGNVQFKPFSPESPAEVNK